MIWLLPAALAIPREDALDNAARYAVHSWTMTSANTEVDCSSAWESDYSPGTYVGLPYDWGGYVTLDEFDDQIAAGYGAGGHSDTGSLWCTTGVDCSGYVSKVWDTGHYSTSTFYEVTTDIGWDDMERADAVNDAGSHIVLFTHLSEGGWPVFYEASGGASKVRLNSDGGWGYVDGYQPVRFDDIEDGGSSGTASNPRSVGAFPFTDYWWTAGAASDTIDSYACSPGSDESGPEVLYRFTTANGGHLEAVVSDADGVDIDIHVMTAPTGDACLVRDDTTVSVDVPPGEVWLSLDSYVGSREYPGPYVLTVAFTEAAEGDGGGDDGNGSGETADTGDTDGAGDTDGDTDDALDELIIPQAERVDGGDQGCATGRAPTWLALAGLAALIRRRR